MIYLNMYIMNMYMCVHKHTMYIYKMVFLLYPGIYKQQMERIVKCQLLKQERKGMISIFLLSF